MNNGGDSSDSITVTPQKPEEDKALLLVTEFRHLTDFDFKNFNYFSFEQDIGDMTKEEFLWWYQTHFEKWLFRLDEDYLDIDFDNNYYKFSNIDEQKIFLLKIVNFVMFLLPYQILKLVFKENGIQETNEIITFLDEDINLIKLRGDVMDGLDHNMTQFDSFIKTLLHFEKVSKKNLVEENIELLDEHVKKQNFFLEIYKGIVQETDMHKMKDLIIQMIETDEKNIL
jgi:hypothetical protein